MPLRSVRPYSSLLATLFAALLMCIGASAGAMQGSAMGGLHAITAEFAPEVVSTRTVHRGALGSTLLLTDALGDEAAGGVASGAMLVTGGTLAGAAGRVSATFGRFGLFESAPVGQQLASRTVVGGALGAVFAPMGMGVQDVSDSAVNYTAADYARGAAIGFAAGAIAEPALGAAGAGFERIASRSAAGRPVRLFGLLDDVEIRIDADDMPGYGSFGGEVGGGVGAARNLVPHGPLNPGPLPGAVANTFRGGSYTANTVSEATTLYRVYGGKAGQIGGYWMRTKPAGSVQSIIDSALNPQWGNTATNVTTIRVPVGTTIYEGAAAAQGGLAGGGSQVFIPKVNPGWLVP